MGRALDLDLAIARLVRAGFGYGEVLAMRWPAFKAQLLAVAELEAETLRNQLILARAAQADEAGFKRVLGLLEAR